MILVTGGTGLVGAHLLFHLLNSGKSVKAIHRKESKLEQVKKVFTYYSKNANGLFQQINWVEADLNDLPALETAFKDVTRVYHCAALISFDPRDYDIMHKINVEGTANIVNLCLALKIEKLCYVSSIGAIGNGIGGVTATEENEWNANKANVYALTKNDAEIEVWRGSQENLDVVSVNPGLILGPGFWYSGSGVLFKTAAENNKYYPPGGTGLITVGDVVRLMTSLMDSTITNERFIAIAENLTYKEILSGIAKGFNKPAPTQRLKFWQLEILWRLDWLRSQITSRGRRLTENAVESLRNPQIYDNTKIKQALDFEFESLEETILFSCNRFTEESL